MPFPPDPDTSQVGIAPAVIAAGNAERANTEAAQTTTQVAGYASTDEAVAILVTAGASFRAPASAFASDYVLNGARFWAFLDNMNMIVSETGAADPTIEAAIAALPSQMERDIRQGELYRGVSFQTTDPLMVLIAPVLPPTWQATWVAIAQHP